MILSQSHKFLFVHVPKTAGTALTAALSPFGVTGTRHLWRRLLRRLPVTESPDHAYLRKHETDRLAALTREINALGGNVIEEETALHITPAPLHGGVFHTYEDHRLATAGAVLGLVVEGIEVENIATTRKTLPDFPGLWSSLLL